MKGEKEVEKYVFDLQKADIDNLNKEEQLEIRSAIVTFGNSKGFSLFMNYLRNSFVNDAMYKNRSIITSEYFNGGIDMLDSIEEYIKETTEYDKNQKINN